MLPKPQPLIRHARLQELPRIADLIGASLQPFRSVVPAETLDRYREYARDVEERWRSGDVLVLESGGGIAGTVTFVDHRLKAAREFPSGWASVQGLMVHPEARGQGFGRSLVGHCIEAARQASATMIGLHTAHFMDNAVRLYRSFGFSRCPEHDFFASAAFGFEPVAGDTRVEAYRLAL
jgi:ribosomal protein S18 acetylase RimI-like enzyme